MNTPLTIYKCPYCKKTFKIKPKNRRKYFILFCSDECFIKYCEEKDKLKNAKVSV